MPFWKARIGWRAVAIAALVLLFALPPFLLPLLEARPGAKAFPAGSPILAEPRIGAALLGVVKDGATELSFDKVVFHPNASRNFGRPNYQLVEILLFYKLAGADREAWVSPDLKFDEASGVMSTDFKSQRRFVPLFACASLGLLASIVCCFRAKAASGWSGLSLRFAFLAALFLRQALFSCYLSCSDNMTARITDGTRYLEIAKEISEGVLIGNGWSYTVGYPLILAPFAKLLQPAGAYAFYDMASLLNSMILSPLLGGLLLAIVWRVSGSPAKGLVSAALFTVLPYFYYPFEVWWQPDCFRAFALPPGLDISCLQPMYVFLWQGHDIMSDQASAFLVLLCVWLALACRPGLLSAALISALFAFSCLVRMNMALFAPLLAFLLLRLNKDALASPKGLFKLLSVSLLSFLAVFSVQFVENVFQYGGLFTTPYSAHPISKYAFSLSMLDKGPEYLLQTNLAFICMGLAGMLFIEGAFKRVLFILWAAPTIVFFCGYSGVAASSVRFILPAYGALFGAFVCASVWDSLGWRRLALAAGVLLANVSLVAPPFIYLRTSYKLQPLGVSSPEARTALTVVVACLSVAIFFIAFRRERRALAFFGCLLALYYVGMGKPLFALLLAALCWALWDFGLDAVKLCLAPCWRALSTRLPRRP